MTKANVLDCSWVNLGSVSMYSIRRPLANLCLHHRAKYIPWARLPFSIRGTPHHQPWKGPRSIKEEILLLEYSHIWGILQYVRPPLNPRSLCVCVCMYFKKYKEFCYSNIQVGRTKCLSFIEIRTNFLKICYSRSLEFLYST